MDRIRANATTLMTALTFICLATMACVPERERQEPHVGLECHDEERCGEYLVCYYNRCHQPCTMDRQCAEPFECIDEICQ